LTTAENHHFCPAFAVFGQYKYGFMGWVHTVEFLGCLTAVKQMDQWLSRPIG